MSEKERDTRLVLAAASSMLVVMAAIKTKIKEPSTWFFFASVILYVQVRTSIADEHRYDCGKICVSATDFPPDFLCRDLLMSTFTT